MISRGGHTYSAMKRSHQFNEPSSPFCSPVVPMFKIIACSPATKNNTFHRKPESALAKTLIAGSVTWTYELCLGHVLEFVKVLKQTKQGSYASLIKEITNQKGITGVWDGFFPWGTIQALAKGAVFGWAHAVAKSSLLPFAESGTLSHNVVDILSGGIGGGVQGLALSPTLLLKTRVMTDPIFRNKMSLLETTKASASTGIRVIKSEGIAALMKGSIVFSLKRVADWSTRFFFSVSVEDAYRHYHRYEKHSVLSLTEQLSASLVGGILSTVFTIPIDVMVAQIQQASKAGSKVSVLDTFKRQYDAGGLSQVTGFATKGFVARVMHVAFTTMLMKTAASAIYAKYEERENN